MIDPCPFCGREPEILKVGKLWTVDCTNNECIMFRDFETKQEAVDVWNKRLWNDM